MEQYDFVSTQEIEARVQRGTPTNTRRSTNFALHVYEQWHEARISPHPECNFPALTELANASNELISCTLCHFVFEIRRRDGKEYPPGSIHGTMCEIMRYFRGECNRPDLNFLRKKTSSTFCAEASIDGCRS